MHMPAVFARLAIQFSGRFEQCGDLSGRLKMSAHGRGLRSLPRAGLRTSGQTLAKAVAPMPRPDRRLRELNLMMLVCNASDIRRVKQTRAEHRFELLGTVAC